MTPILPPSAPLRSSRSARLGYTFLELLVVMGVMAVIFGFGIGYLTNVGRAAQAQQAASKITESASRCQNLSAGGRRATLELRERMGANGEMELVVYTAVQRPVLTANFEPAPKDHPELDWFVNSGSPDNARPVGQVHLEDDGRTAAALSRGGYVDFGTRPGFAVTDGVFVDCWVKAASGGGNMRVMQSEHSPQNFWTISLVKPAGTGPDAYQVDFRLWLVPGEAEEAATTVSPEIFLTKDACVTANRWTHLQASFDGRDASVRVDSVERLVREKRKGPALPKDAEGPGLRRFARTPEGVAHLTLSAPGASFVGSIDTLEVAGIFRTSEDIQRLGGGVEVVRPPLPVRVVYSNGRLDSAIHANDVVILLATPSDIQSGTGYEIRLGLYGSIPPPRRIVQSAAAQAAVPTAPNAPPGTTPSNPAPPQPEATPDGMGGGK